jgi:hypothetical protein
MDPKCGHEKNEVVYVQLSIKIVFHQVNIGQVVQDKKKLI